MFSPATIFIILRTFVQYVCDDYASVSGECNTLLNKAVAETLPDIRSAYFLKVMEADNKAVHTTFAKYHIGFLASNTTYASEAEIMNQACKMPAMTLEFLDWTAGVLPLFVVWVVFLASQHSRYLKCCKSKPMQVVEIQQPEIEMTEPPRDTPPRSPLHVPVYQEQRDYRQEPLEKEKPEGIRRRTVRPARKKKEGPSVLETLTSLSPSLKNRIMGDDPMV